MDESREKYCAVAFMNVFLCCSSVAGRVSVSRGVDAFERALIAKPAD